MRCSFADSAYDPVMLLLLAAVAAVVVLANRRMRRYAIAHYSMAPSLQPGDWVVAVKRREAQRGRVVVVTHPQRPELELVKRVVGLPYEIVEVDSGIVRIDGVPIHEPWAVAPTTGSGTWPLDNHLFVLGDNRMRSIDDSRSLGPIPVENGVWEVSFRYWPPHRIGTVAVPSQ